MKTLYIFVFILTLGFVSLELNSQTLTQNIRGTVVDRDSKMPLIGVNLILVDSNPLVGQATDIDGRFAFNNLPLGRYNIKVQYLGYETKMVQDVLLVAGKEVVLNINLVESIKKVEEVVISAKRHNAEALNKMATVSARSFTVEETKRYAGSFNDPSRMASSFAGVSGDPDGANDIVIRGNSPRGLLWRMEGIEIPNPNHFAEEGASGGPISILNSNMLASSDFFTGAFPAEYGNAYSGVFDINLRKGNDQKKEYSLMAGVLGVDCSVEGPFSNRSNASYLVNYRYSSVSILNALGVKVAGDAVPKFQDFSYNVYVPTKNFGNFKFFGIGGLSSVDEKSESYKNVFGTNMGVAGVSNTYRINKKSFVKSTLAVTGSSNIWEYSEKTSEAIDFEKLGHETFLYTTGKFATSLNTKFNSRVSMKTGVIYSKLFYDLSSGYLNEDHTRYLNEVGEDGNSDLWQGYSSWKFRLTNALTLNAGLHSMYFMLNNNSTIEPRFGMRYQVNEKQAVSAGFGVHSRMETITNYFARNNNDDGTYFQPNLNMDFAKARHYVLGYERLLSENLFLKTEVYFQDIYNVPIVDSINSSFSSLNHSYGIADFKLENKGTGQNYGAEITLERSFANNYYFLITTSLYNSKYKGGDGIERNTRYNGNYVFNVLGGKEFILGSGMQNKTLTVSLRASVAGGSRYTPIDLEASREQGYTVRFEDKAWSAQRDDFIRCDLKLSYSKNKENTTRQWVIDIQNVTNTLNVAGDYYNSDLDKIETWTQMGLIPVLSYRIDF